QRGHRGKREDRFKINLKLIFGNAYIAVIHGYCGGGAACCEWRIRPVTFRPVLELWTVLGLPAVARRAKEGSVCPEFGVFGEGM
ncbi:MAG: hypothetical protein WD490_00425, partial [Opitutales bacterium]